MKLKCLIFNTYALTLMSIAFISMSIAFSITKTRYRDSNAQVDSLRCAYNILVDSLRCAEDAKTQEWNALIEALIEVESNGHKDAVGDGGNAVGVLQIHPIVIEECNRFGFNFSLEDRYDREKSIEIFNACQSVHNPKRDIHWALKLQNPRSSVAYHRNVIRKMNKILEP